MASHLVDIETWPSVFHCKLYLLHLFAQAYVDGSAPRVSPDIAKRFLRNPVQAGSYLEGDRVGGGHVSEMESHVKSLDAKVLNQ